MCRSTALLQFGSTLRDARRKFLDLPLDAIFRANHGEIVGEFSEMVSSKGKISAENDKLT